MYTLAGEWGTGSHPLGLPSIDVSRQSTGHGKTMRLRKSLRTKVLGLSLIDPRQGSTYAGGRTGVPEGPEFDSVSQQLTSPAGEPKTSLGQKELPSQFTISWCEKQRERAAKTCRDV